MTDTGCYLAASKLLAEQKSVGRGRWVCSLDLPFDVIFDDTVHYSEICGLPMPRQSEGMCIKSGNKNVILYSPGWDIPHINYTLAHEIGHIILGHTGKDTDEAQANAFACALLVHGAPLRAFTELCGRDAYGVSRFFGVSKSCARIALERSDIRTVYDDKILCLYDERLRRFNNKNPLDIPFEL